ncbi:MAG: hypothetical protein H6500_07205 [Candidatus Woesearchaeota archaeon]|nr:hypothetical protein [Nanoarchaeota archaeon]USN44147.1 MAG: hypothetical protein H6500_07205 [Candidatus Woesearchaeota archaeon]
MISTIENKLENIENFLQRIESKIDNFMGFEEIEDSEKKELINIKKEMNEGKYNSYDDVFK